MLRRSTIQPEDTFLVEVIWESVTKQLGSSEADRGML